MSGINTGILTNALPLSTERIKELEKEALENQTTIAYLNENSELCFVLPFEPGVIKDLAWNNAYELTVEENSFIKKAYKKDGLESFYLEKVLQKQNIEDSWVDYAGEPEDELAGTWVFNYKPVVADNFTYDVGFICDGREFNTLASLFYSSHLYYIEYDDIFAYVYDQDDVAGGTGWKNDASKTITITSKLSEVTNGDALLTWLKANATKQTVSNGEETNEFGTTVVINSFTEETNEFGTTVII